jgi:hypothetical protein
MALSVAHCNRYASHFPQFQVKGICGSFRVEMRRLPTAFRKNSMNRLCTAVLIFIVALALSSGFSMTQAATAPAGVSSATASNSPVIGPASQGFLFDFLRSIFAFLRNLFGGGGGGGTDGKDGVATDGKDGGSVDAKDVTDGGGKDGVG